MPNARLEPEPQTVKWTCECSWSFERSLDHGAAAVCPSCHRLSFSTTPDRPDLSAEPEAKAA